MNSKKKYKITETTKIFFVAMFVFIISGINNLTYSQTTQTFTSSGTFTVPTGVTAVKVECWGSGGAGGRANGNPGSGGGGAGGSYASSILTSVTGSYTVTVGTAKASSNNNTASNNNGNPSWFGSTSTVYAIGGNGGAGTSNNNTDGAAGTGSTTGCIGNLNILSGGNGATGNYNNGVNGGSGGGGAGSSTVGNDASGGTGGTGGIGNPGNGDGANGVSNSNGIDGANYGGGGSGGDARSTTNRTGGSGAAGAVIVSWITVSFSTTDVSVAGNDGAIIVTASGGDGNYTYSLNGGTYQSGNSFTGLSAGAYTVTVKDGQGLTTTAVAIVNGINYWIGAVYVGMNFESYQGYYTESETFDESFGGSATNFTLSGSGGSIYTDNFSVRYSMHSNRTGLYVVDLGSDDGSRLTVDGTTVYNNWSDQAWSSKPRVLMNLTGNSSLVYEFYENTGGNQITYSNQTLVLANQLSTNTLQYIPLGNSGSAISGDTYGTLPTGISKSGTTGYQWYYSTSPTGAKTLISGATGASYTPNTTTSPFNSTGIYYLYRYATLTSTNNTGVTNYTSSNVSNAAIIRVTNITVSTTSLTLFTYAENNGPSTEKTFNVSGGGLSENIKLTLPTNSHYELSTTSGGTFSGSVDALLNNNGSGTVISTPIYVRLKAGLTVGTYNDVVNDVITAASLGATSKTVTCSGSVTNQPLITVTPGSLTGLGYVLGSGTSTAQSFAVTGANLQSNITVTAPADYQISTSSGGTYYQSLTLTNSGGNVNTTVWVRLTTGLSTSTYNEDVTLTATYALTKTVNCQGAVNRATINVSKFTLAGFIYTLGSGPSDIQNFDVSGTTLSADITITAPAHFIISTPTYNGGAWGTSITLTQAGGVVTSKTISVRMITGISPTQTIAAENMYLTSNNAITQTVACSGAVVSGAATISSKPTLNGFFYIVGHGPSVTQSFTVSATSLGTNNVTVTAPTDFEVSSLGTEGSFGNTVTITPVSQKVNAFLIYIRFKSGRLTGTYNEAATITAPGSGATQVNVACNGKVVDQPTIVAGPSNPLSACANSSVSLTSSGTANIDNYTWNGPNSFYSTAQNPNSFTATPASSGNYIVTGNIGSGVNLLTNGDFELGNIGFGSTYTYVNGQISYGQYAVVSNAHDADPTYFLNAYDHTNPNTGKQMVLDGSTSTGEIVWAQTVSVNSNTAYQFSFWAQNISNQTSTSYGELQLYVNNVPVGVLNTIVTKGWVNFLSNLNSGLNTSLQLTLINFNQNGSANDFAIDDLKFEQVLQVSDTLALTVNPVVTPTVVISASANPSTTGATVTFTATPTYGGTTPSYTWYVNGSTVSTGTSSTYSYVPTTGDLVKCVLTSSLNCTTTNPTSNTIPMTVNPATNYWKGTNGTDWGTTTNWTGGYIPEPGADVIFATSANNNNSPAVSDLVLDQDRTQGNLINQTTKNLIIPAGKTLTLNSTITTDNNVDRIYIQASSTGPNGSLIFYANNPVYGTVEMYSKANWDLAGVQGYHYNWQYFGIPVTTLKASPTLDGSYIRRWDETGIDITSHWLSINNDYYLEPFKGYEITQQVTTGKTIVFQGQLVNSNFTSANPLTITSTAMFPGQYIFANPYTAAIDIRQLTLGAGTDGSVYLYNTGSFGAWTVVNGSFNTDGINPLAGQYVSVLPNYAGTYQIPRQVPSMGAMLIRPYNIASSANYYFNINYNSVVMKNTDAQRAPKEVEVSTSDKVGMIVDVKGAHAADRMWIFTNSTSSYGFDNGWDGQKILGSALTPQLYSIEKDGNYQVNTLPDMNGTELAFQAGQDVEDTLTFTNMNLEKQYAGVYLVDLQENRTIDITATGTQYAFMAASTPTPVTRFKIVTRPYEKNTPDAETQVKVFSAGNSIYVQNLGSADGNCRVYDIAGHYLMNVPFSSNNVTTITNSLRPGAYIAMAIAGGEKVSKRLIVQ